MKAICKYFGVTYKAPAAEKPTNDKNSSKKETYYRVVVGSYKDKENANDMVNELKKKGYDPFIVAHEE